MESDFWTVIRAVEGWDDMKMAYAASMTFSVIGGLKIRMIDPFAHFPWPLLGMRDEASAARKTQVSEALIRCPVSHLEPGIAGPVRSLHDTVEGFLNDVGLHAELAVVGENVSNNNIASEDRIGRQNGYSNVTRGNVPTHYNIAARHVLPEVSCWHRLAMDALHRQLTSAPVPTRGPRDRKYRTSHLAFIAINSALYGGDMVRLGTAWKILSKAERQGYSLYVRAPGEEAEGEEDEEERVGQDGGSFEEQARRASPFKLGTSSYAMSPEDAEVATENLQRSARQWAKVVGPLIGEDESIDEGTMFHQCSEIVPFGRCTAEFTARERERMSALQKLLVAMSRRPSESIGGISMLNLYVITVPMPAAGSGDVVAPPAEVIYLFLNVWPARP